ncbi:hypothetical protein GCM10025857_09010 [Alicyclobacillus contaminans]|nr:hypothetical protein [Alicyclobacillus contaminans]GMA49544.1 hypothetical protein GCM10025857_09010 [Alicyclobacillus contaminans]
MRNLQWVGDDARMAGLCRTGTGIRITGISACNIPQRMGKTSAP